MNLYEYNATDAACTLVCHDSFWDDLDQAGYRAAYDMTVDLFPAIMFMETRGIRVSLDELDVTKDQITQQAEEKRVELNQLCGREINPLSSKDCQAYFYVELGIQPYYEEGKITVNDLALQRLSRGTAKRPGLRQAKLIQEIRGLEKLRGTYLNIEFDADGRMRCSYNPRGTKFGRLSSSKTIYGTGTNQQNLPQAFKRFLVPDAGYIFWEVDKRQAEWVVVAYLSGDANMIKVIEEGRDTHLHTASLMFGVSPEILAREDKLIGTASDPDFIREVRESDPELAPLAERLPRTMSGRQCGKKSNHGLNYDEGPDKFALINEVEQREGRRIHAMYHLIYPGIKVWYTNIQRQLQKDRTLTNCFGRKVRFMDAWGPDLFKAAYSMLPQSTVVDCVNQGMAKIYADDSLCSLSGMNIDLLAQVHDSILFQVPIEVVKSERFAQAQQLVYNYVSQELNYNGRSFRIATDMKMGMNWGGYHPERNPLGMREIKKLDQLPALLGEWSVQS